MGNWTFGRKLGAGFAVSVVALIIIVALARARPSHREGLPKPLEVGIGFITNFFDTLGIGSFAPTTSHRITPPTIPAPSRSSIGKPSPAKHIN